MAVISPAVFVSEQFLCSHADALSWEDFVASLPSLPKENKHEGERVAEPATASIPDLEFLEDYLNPGPSAAAASSSSSRSRPEAVPLDDELADEVLAEIRRKRDEWVAEAADTLIHFKTSLRGGLWTRTHIGVPIDSVRGYAATAEAIDWVQSCGLPKTTTLSYNRYGEQWAQQLCMYWARTLEHFFDAFSLCARLAGEDWDAVVDARPVDEELEAAMLGLVETHPCRIFFVKVQSLVPVPAAGAASSSGKNGLHN